MIPDAQELQRWLNTALPLSDRALSLLKQMEAALKEANVTIIQSITQQLSETIQSWEKLNEERIQMLEKQGFVPNADGMTALIKQLQDTHHYEYEQNWKLLKKHLDEAQKLNWKNTKLSRNAKQMTDRLLSLYLGREVESITYNASGQVSTSKK